MSKPKYAITVLFRRYFDVFKQVWSIRHTLDSPPRTKDELAFLPAHLELVETPVPAAPKWTARLIVAFAMMALLWAMIGQMDIVAVAQGKTSNLGKAKTIQPIETAKVISIAVTEGQQVKTGDVLATLTQAGIESDVAKGNDSQLALLLSIIRDEALLQAIDLRKMPMVELALFDKLSWDMSVKQPSNIQLQEAQNLATTQYQNFLLKDEQLNTNLMQLSYDVQATDVQIHQLTQSLILEQKKLDDYQNLLGLDAIAQHDYYTQKSKVLGLENELNQAKAKQKQLQGQQQEIKKQQQLVQTELVKNTLKNLKQAYDNLKIYQAEHQKALERRQMMTLTAPTDGYVQELAIHTVGGVVTSAQTLMVIAPTDDKLQVEALILNKDIGFVHIGQSAKIKLEAYPYTRYGYLTGQVKHISLESIRHEQLGLVYAAIIELDKDDLMIDGERIQVGSGMNATVEIKTGHRRVIDYLLSPLQTKIDEAMQER